MLEALVFVSNIVQYGINQARKHRLNASTWKVEAGGSGLCSRKVGYKVSWRRAWDMLNLVQNNSNEDR